MRRHCAGAPCGAPPALHPRCAMITSVDDAADFARVAADRSRLAILGRLALGDCDAEELVAVCHLDRRRSARILGRLVTSGLVGVSDGVYSLDEEALRRVAASVTLAEPVDSALLVGVEGEERTVAARYFRGRRLVEIPTGAARRRVVLEILADELIPGRYYREAELRTLLRRFHPDDAALRRHMVDDGLVDRDPASGVYWRGGGPPPRADEPGLAPTADDEPRSSLARRVAD